MKMSIRLALRPLWKLHHNHLRCRYVMNHLGVMVPLLTIFLVVLLMRVHALFKRQTLVARSVLGISFALWVIGLALLIDLSRVSRF
jgi:hypothetical protein